MTVLEGIVRVTPRAAQTRESQPTELSAGEGAQITTQRVSKQTANIEASTAWRRQQLVFADASLAEVASELNRYNQLQLVVDAEVGAAEENRLSGTFDSRNPEALLLHLGRTGRLSIVREGQRVTIGSR